MKIKKYNLIIVGGGAAGFFTAINAAEANPALSIAILERGNEVLTKVKISGGGRCNVTHAQFNPKELAQNYPRGEKELVGPFHRFMTGDTIAWFEKRGIELKIEEDGRMFPVTDSSQTIIDCFTSETKRLHIDVLKQQAVKNLLKENEQWHITTTEASFIADTVVIASGSNPKIWKLLQKMGHTIVPAVPSLFTFNIKDPRITDIPGIATEANVKIITETGKVQLESEGPLLITHWGMSGPAILKLSAWGARILAPLEYQFTIEVNWLLHLSEEETILSLKNRKTSLNKKSVLKYAQFDLPKRLWINLIKAAGISEEQTWAEITNSQMAAMAGQLSSSRFKVSGKSTFKEEFVTAGGVDLKEINFKTFESKLHPALYFAGEVVNIDAITGGFNFQNAWTGGYLVAQAIAAPISD